MNSDIKSLPYEHFGIDREYTLSILEKINRKHPGTSPETYTFPEPNMKNLIMVDADFSFSIRKDAIPGYINDCCKWQSWDTVTESDDGRECIFSLEALNLLGLHLLSRTAYGILNGGLATSFIDRNKNRNYQPSLYPLISNIFESAAPLQQGKPKALSPGYINPDGSPGYSFIELKMRALLILMMKSYAATGTFTPIPLFEMRNEKTDSVLSVKYNQLRTSALLGELIENMDYDITSIRKRNQPLIAAFTHSEEGTPRTVFTKANGEKGKLLALPGGHGQNFSVLKPIYRELHEEGYLFTYLVNIDNIGNTPDPVHIALTALTSSQASFEFTPKTQMDTKGGVLVRNSKGNYICVDIGTALSLDSVLSAEREGTRILFNCATGLFNLEYLNSHIDEIIREIPIRLSDQEKDTGKYSQAEQITWEMMDLFPESLILSVNKERRFIAAKLFSELILTSCAESIAPRLLSTDPSTESLCDKAVAMQKGLNFLLDEIYGMKLSKGKWVPLSFDELKKRFAL